MNEIGWGQGVLNNSRGWGDCQKNNSLQFALIYKKSYSGETILT